MEPSRVPAQKNFKGEGLYTVFIPPWRKQSKAVIWCTLLKNHLHSHRKVMWFTPYSFPSPLPKEHFLLNLSKPGWLSHKSITANDYGMASRGRRSGPRASAWDGNWSGVTALSLGVSYPFPSFRSALALAHSPVLLLLQECHAKHEPAHPQLQTPKAMVIRGKAHVEGPLFPFFL